MKLKEFYTKDIIREKGKIFYHKYFNHNASYRMGNSDYITITIINQVIGFIIGFYFYDYLLYSILILLCIEYVVWYNLVAVGLIE